MAKVKVRLDKGGMAAMLKSSEVASAVHGRAIAVEANIDTTTSQGEVMDTFVNDYTTDRAASSVVLAHPAALRHQAKYGTLTRAASAAGLEVKAKGSSS